MSAPTTHDPVAVTTADGTSWVRRAVTRDGRGLYAVDGSCQCPEFLMATLAELAEHGIQGMADALPMPAGPALLSAREVVDRALGDDAGRFGLALDRAFVELRKGGFLTSPAREADVDSLVSGLWARIAELEAQRERRRVRLVALSNDALSMRGSLSPMGEGRKVPFPLGETLTPAVDWLIGRVAELEARPSPADVLRRAADDLTAACPDHSDADEAWMDCPCEFADELRRNADLAGSVVDACACPPADRPGPHQVGCPLDGVPGPDERPVNGFTAVFSPVASLREPDGEFDAYLRHPYRTGHDLPEAGGV